MVWEISTWQTNKLPSLIDRCCNILFFDVYDPSVYKRFVVYMMRWHFVIVYMYFLLNSYGMELKILICDKCLAHHVDTYNYESTNTNQTIRSLHIKLKRLFTYQDESKPKTLCDNKQIIHKCLILHLSPILLSVPKFYHNVTLFCVFCLIFYTM